MIMVHECLEQEQNSLAPISWHLFHELVLLLVARRKGFSH
jgi:hypothetical protein